MSLKQINGEALQTFAGLLPNLDGFNDPQILLDYQTDFVALADVLLQLSMYAANKKWAMAHRLEGEIAKVQVYENECDKIHDALPDWAKW